MSNNLEQLKNIYKNCQIMIKKIDSKNGLLLTISSILIVVLSIINQLINKYLFISLITILSLSILFFILAIFPIFWNKNEKHRNNPLHIPTIWKNKDDLTFLSRNILKEDYIIQINRLSMIIKIKYIFQIIGITWLCITIILIIISVCLI